MATGRPRRHSQLPPRYECLACRAGECKDCLDSILPGITVLENERMCDCKHDGETIPKQYVWKGDHRRPPARDNFPLTEADITSIRGRAKPRIIDHDADRPPTP